MTKDKARSILHNIISHIDMDKINDIFVAGGCVRDTITNKDISDIDIFISRKDFEIINKTVPYIFEDKSVDVGDDYCNPAYEFTCMSTTIYGEKVDFIVVEKTDAFRVIHKFPVGLSQVRLSLKTKRLHGSSCFKKDLRNKTITLKEKTTYPSKYVQKIATKYKVYYDHSEWKLKRFL